MKNLILVLSLIAPACSGLQEITPEEQQLIDEARQDALKRIMEDSDPSVVSTINGLSGYAGVALVTLLSAWARARNKRSDLMKHDMKEDIEFLKKKLIEEAAKHEPIQS